MSAAKCTATSKRTGKRCGANAVKGRTVCYHHGGRTPRGADLPQTKTGRWSKDLPTRLAAKYHEALKDAKLLELRDELAIIDARLSDLLAGMDTGEAGAIWAALRKARKDFEDPAKRMDALKEILVLIERGAEAWQQWEDVFRTIERRARIAESERRRLVEAQQMISAEQVNVLIAAVSSVIRQHVNDRDALRRISADIGGLLSAGPSVQH